MKQKVYKDDFDFFVKNYDNLFKKHGHKFFVISNMEILGAYDTLSDAYKSTENIKGKFIVQECNGSESAYKAEVFRLKVPTKDDENLWNQLVRLLTGAKRAI